MAIATENYPGPDWVSKGECSYGTRLAKDVLVMAALGGMPYTFWLTDSRISRARRVLEWSPTEAYEWAHKEI